MTTNVISRNPETYIGLMSGTSLDAIDVALLDFTDDQINLLATHSHAFPDALKQTIQQLNQPGQRDEIHRMAVADLQLADVFAEAVSALLGQAGKQASSIKALGSHGQTIRHQPNDATPYTLQIGDPNRLAELTGITTVGDFRRRDMAAGGQGAPLAPAFHAALFRTTRENRTILNLGGMANLTLLPADLAQAVTGFDTGPGNILLNAWYQRHHNEAYDQNGLWAGTGQVSEQLLAALLELPFYSITPPRSTGREQFNLEYLDHILDQITLSPKPEAAPENIQATLSELTARSVAHALTTWGGDCARLLVCGGGVFNTDLLKRLAVQLPGLSIESCAAYGMAPEWIEAAAFAWLARQTLHHHSGNLAEVTGATHNVVLGGIYLS
ncbi:MAG TPA: anhydro-N-acetylmuramic acid kinase [Gammaproteobacteria bacterium]|nr:anhydro-N-acetylmuramic acid kinase [Gammaproteobacteria bacterium]